VERRDGIKIFLRLFQCHETPLFRYIPWLAVHCCRPGRALCYYLVKGRLDFWIIPIALVEITAIVAGIFLLKGRNWARWLVLMWLAFHVVVSALDSFSSSVPHFLLLIAVGYFLFTPPDSRYFKSAPSK
jgi:hypothetical protein